MSTDDITGVVDSVIFAADMAALDIGSSPAAMQVRAAVTEAFRCAVGNGLITVAPRAGWPEWISLQPPYGQSGDER